MYVCNGTWTAPAWRWRPPTTALISIPLLSASQNNWHTTACIGTKCCCWNCPLRKDFLEILGWNTSINTEKHTWVNPRIPLAHRHTEPVNATDVWTSLSAIFSILTFLLFSIWLTVHHSQNDSPDSNTAAPDSIKSETPCYTIYMRMFSDGRLQYVLLSP